MQEIINKLEERLKNLRIDQMTDDAMNPKKFEGYSQALEEVIEELKQHNKDKG